MSASSPARSAVCDLCSAALGEPHQHLLQPAARKLECVCDACAILFSSDQQNYRRVPRRIRFLREFRLTAEQWEGLAIPIGVAFFVRTSSTGRVAAFYPSPAGPVESLLELETWEDIERANPDLKSIEPDVEGLLAYRGRSSEEYFIIPIDECFRLVGIIRLKWKGFSGGMGVWQEIGTFLDELKQRSR